MDVQIPEAKAPEPTGEKISDVPYGKEAYEAVVARGNPNEIFLAGGRNQASFQDAINFGMQMPAAKAQQVAAVASNGTDVPDVLDSHYIDMAQKAHATVAEIKNLMSDPEGNRDVINYIKNPVKYGQWQGNLDVLKQLSESARQANQETEGWGGEAGRAIKATALSAVHGIASMEDTVMQMGGSDLSYGHDLLDKAMGNIEATQEANRFYGAGDFWHHPLYGVTGAAGGVGSAIASDIMTGGGAVAVFAASGYSEELRQAKQEGAGEGIAQLRAAAHGAFAGLMGSIYRGDQMQLMKSLSGNALQRFGGLVAQGAAQGGEVALLGKAGEAVDYATGQPKNSDFTFDNVKQQVADTLGQWVANTVVMTAAGGVSTAGIRRQEAAYITTAHETNKAILNENLGASIRQAALKVSENPAEAEAVAKTFIQKAGQEDTVSINTQDVLNQAKVVSKGVPSAEKMILDEFERTTGMKVDPNAPAVSGKWSKFDSATGSPLIDALNQAGVVARGKDGKSLGMAKEDIKTASDEMVKTSKEYKQLVSEPVPEEWQNHFDTLQKKLGTEKAKTEVAGMRYMLKGYAKRYFDMDEAAFMKAHPFDIQLDEEGRTKIVPKQNLVEKVANAVTGKQAEGIGEEPKGMKEPSESKKEELQKGQNKISKEQAMALFGGLKKLLPKEGEIKPQINDTEGRELKRCNRQGVGTTWTNF